MTKESGKEVVMNKKEIILKQIDRLYDEFDAACDDIAVDCEKEGYPSYGDNWDLRCNNLWEWMYKPDIEYLESKLETL